MKVAVLSDIHGNLTALNAVLNDINRLGIDKYIIAGDHIMDCPQNNEVLDKIRTLNAYVIKGNREKYILDYNEGLHNEWNEHKQMAATVWAYKVLNEGNLRYINGMSEQLVISLPDMNSIRVVHGSPLNISEELFPDKNSERIEKSLEAIEESVLICGHTHEAWSKVIHEKLVVNPGSVGVPFNKNKAAEYAVLTWCDNHWRVSHHQVNYDINELEQIFIRTGLFEKCRVWSRLTLLCIKEGKDITKEFLRYAYKEVEKDGIKNVNLIPDAIWDRAAELWFEKY